MRKKEQIITFSFFESSTPCNWEIHMSLLKERDRPNGRVHTKGSFETIFSVCCYPWSIVLGTSGTLRIIPNGKDEIIYILS